MPTPDSRVALLGETGGTNIWLALLRGASTVDSVQPDPRVGAILRGLLGYNADPSILEVVAWLGYLLIVGALYLRPVAAPSPKRSAVADGSLKP